MTERRRADTYALLADEHIPVAVVNRLRLWNVDVKHVSDSDVRGASDSELVELAQAEDRVIVTADKQDFPRIAKDTDHPGMIVVTERLSNGDLLQELMTVLDTLDTADIADTVQYIPWRV